MLNQKTYKKFLEALEKLKIDNGTVSLEPLSSVKNNYTSLVLKARVEAEEEVYHFILKCGTDDAFIRSLIPVAKFFEREVFCYQKIFPEFEKLQAEQNVENVARFYPKFYHSNDDELDEMIVLEDMTPRGYRLKPKKETLDYEHIRVALKEYARLHALCFALRDQKRTVFDELAKDARDFFFTDFSSGEYRYYCVGCKKILDSIDCDKQKDLFVTLAKTFIDHPTIMEEVFKGDLTTDQSVFTHADCRSANILFKYRKDGSVSKACLVDWQLAVLASPVIDVLYVIFINTDKALRNKHYEDFITYYYETFSKFLRSLGSDPEKLFSFEALQMHTKKYGVHSMLFAVLTLYLILDGFEEEHERGNYFLERINDLIVDCFNLGILNRDK